MSAKKFKCPSCGATGLYRGMAEGVGQAVICWTCDGNGWVPKKKASDLTLKEPKPFSVRSSMRGVTHVFRAASALFHSGTPVTYEEFLTGQRPEGNEPSLGFAEGKTTFFKE